MFTFGGIEKSYYFCTRQNQPHQGEDKQQVITNFHWEFLYRGID